jgi:hypothetical protein
MKKKVREILSKYRQNEGYTMEHAERELLDLFSVMRSDCEIEEIVEQNKDYVLGFYTGDELKEYLSNNYA